VGGLVGGDAFCPTDPHFRAYLTDLVCRSARAGAKIIMLDDDLCLNVRPGIGCACDRHLALYRERIGKPVLREELKKQIYSGPANQYRQAWLSLMKETLIDFCRSLRQALDQIDPSVRMGFCAGYTSWDMEGADAISLTRILAGGTRPFLRLSGAPYWAETRRFPGQTMPHIVEFARMQQTWCEDADIDFFTENDAYPRPRYRVPSAYLETFDFCMSASGCPHQIKYMLDYHSAPDYETGYLRNHRKNRQIIETTAVVANRLAPAGIYVHEPMRKLSQLTLPDHASDDFLMRYSSFSAAASLLGGLGIPTSYRNGHGIAAAFGESGRSVPLHGQKGYLLDAVSALLLQERGVDTGILSAVPTDVRPSFEFFPDFGDRAEISWLDTTEESVFYTASLDPRAGIQSVFRYESGEFHASYFYVNGNGTPFFVLLFDAGSLLGGGSLFRSYYRQRQLTDAAKRMGEPLPAILEREPGAYLICRQGEDQLSVSLCNFCLDPIDEPQIFLEETWTRAEAVGCRALLNSRILTLSDLPPYAFASILLLR
jgi:hypothetical protein